MHVSTGPATALARQDLVYYESPPAIQLLHCLRFDETIQGGATTFVDAVAVAETLRVVDPEAFHVLTKVPATFQKIHYDRPEPVHLVYRRPHISVNNAGDVIGVFWAPSFEGALLVPEEHVCEYFRAYRKFANLLEGRQEEGGLRTEGDSKIRLRLKPGQLVAFNNRRMVHGRDAFEDTGQGGRHLQGCYLSMEVFANRCLVSPTIRNMRVYPVHTCLIMDVYSYVCKLHVYMFTCLNTIILSVRIHMQIQGRYACMHACMHACVFCEHMHVSMQACRRVCKRQFMRRKTDRNSSRTRTSIDMISGYSGFASFTMSSFHHATATPVWSFLALRTRITLDSMYLPGRGNPYSFRFGSTPYY